MPLNQEQIRKFHEQRKRLGQMLADSSEVITELNMTSAGENLKKLSTKVNNDTFKIQVIGTFKNGKSTFINALLGEPVLPAYALPCTAVINEVKYGAKKRAVLYFRNPLPEVLPATISPKAMSHMRAYGMKDVPPLEIDYHEIEDYVTIPMGEDPTELLLESPYEKVELYWPLDILEEGVEIIDSPGLNEAETRTKVTMNYLSQADAILFVLNAQALCSYDEMNFIEQNLRANGFTDPFFVVNRFDCIPEDQRDKLKKYAHMKLSEFSTNDIYFLSAQQALDGSNNPELYNQSGMPLFSIRLAEFLTKDKGRIKLSQPARELKRILNNEALYSVIPQQRSMLDHSIDEVQNRYEKAKPQLEALKAKKQQLIDRLMLRIEQCKEEFKRCSISNSVSLSQLIPGWIAEFQPKTKFSVIPSKSKTEAVVTEIRDYVTQKIQEHLNQWKTEVLGSLIDEKRAFVFESMEQDVTNLYEQIDEINKQIAGFEDIKDVNHPDVPLAERIGAGVAGLLVGDIASGFSGSVHGFSKDLIQTISVQVGGQLLLFLLNAWNPVTVVALILSSVVHSWRKGQSKAMTSTKNLVTEQFVNKISESSDDIANTISESITKVFADNAHSLSTKIDEDIQQSEEQVQAIIAEMQKGEEGIAKRKEVIAECENKVKALSSDLDTLTFELLEQR